MLSVYLTSLLLLGHVCVTQARPGLNTWALCVEWKQCTGCPGTRERYRSCVHEVLEIAHEEPSSHSHSHDNDIPWCEKEEC
ncbi:hypothetical protein DPMN_148192 [Dreissena polymorpha]|uniref:Uncharacterized protein n=1 Tax=Dreissena polymorpha TaxID=45954 RepID=A0A9D4FDI0_DREPO|nr:hypothetical protein DPMN_148192 [Dreissena polymorpha]